MLFRLDNPDALDVDFEQVIISVILFTVLRTSYFVGYIGCNVPFWKIFSDILDCECSCFVIPIIILPGVACRGNMAVVNVDIRNVNIDVRNKITETITNLKTIKHTIPTAEKIFSYLRKSDEELVVVLQSYLEKLVADKYLQAKGSNGNETFTIAKRRHTPECDNFTQQSLNSSPAQVRILLAACLRFEMVRISDNGTGWK